MLALFFGAAVLGIIIAAMEEGDFPGWFPMIICILAGVIPAGAINSLLPPEMFFIGTTVGALCSTIAISALCGMTVKRALIAATIYDAFQIGLTLLINWMT